MSKPGRTQVPVPGRHRVDFEDLPAYDPDVMENPPPPPGSPDRSKPVALTPERAKEIYREHVQRLADLPANAPIATQRDLALATQRARLVWILVNEGEGKDSDPDALKELGLYLKFLGHGKDDFPDPGTEEDSAEQERAAELLSQRGIAPDQAGRLIRTIRSLVGAGGNGGPDDNDRSRPGLDALFGGERRRREAH